jgi:hypothetical protein
MTARPNNLQEHAAYLSNYLKEALKCIESATDQPVPTPLVKTLISATYALLKKVESTLDNATGPCGDPQRFEDNRNNSTDHGTTAQKSAIATQQAATISQDIHTITKEAAEAGKVTTTLVQETNTIAILPSTQEFICISTQ